MLRTRFPIWYPFQVIKSIDFKITLNDLEDLLKERLETYSSGDFNYSQETGESYEQYLERMTQERKSYSILKMGVANDEIENGYLSSWFVEKEGDLFEQRFKDISWEEKIPIMNHLFPADDFGQNWMEIDQLSTYLGEDLYEVLNFGSETHLKYKLTRGKFTKGIREEQGLHKAIGINFRYATYVVRERKSRLYKGWVVDTLDKLASTVKKRFEAVLRKDLIEYAEKIKTQAPGHIKRLTEHIRGVLSSLIPRPSSFDFSNFEFEGTYEENMLLFPPCIQDLMNQMKTSGYLKHHNRFQLGLFLKHTGMSVDDQMQYWYDLAVDNLNITFEQFKKNVGYTIRHLYGLEGRQVDYEMMSCGTIQSTANYHCRFQDMKLEKIKEILREYIVSLPGSEQLRKAELFKEELDPLVGQGEPSKACAKNLQLTVGPIRERINHPLHYLEMAIQATPNYKKEDDDPNLSGENGDEPSPSNNDQTAEKQPVDDSTETSITEEVSS